MQMHCVYCTTGTEPNSSGNSHRPVQHNSASVLESTPQQHMVLQHPKTALRKAGSQPGTADKQPRHTSLFAIQSKPPRLPTALSSMRNGNGRRQERQRFMARFHSCGVLLLKRLSRGASRALAGGRNRARPSKAGTQGKGKGGGGG